MNKKIFIEPLDNKFFSNNFGKKYVHKKNFINDANSVVSLEILDDMLSKSNIWNNKNFKMMLDQKTLKFMYNVADVTVNIASNEGFGISWCESLHAGTPIINNVTGGLQDGCRFETKDGEMVGIFGPVITRVPDKDQSLELWDSVMTLTKTPGFWELKRTRTEKPEFGERP